MHPVNIIFFCLGVGSCLFALAVRRNPRLALRGRRAKRWVSLIGEEKTIKLGQIVGVPLAFLMGVGFMWMGATGKAKELSEHKNHAQTDSAAPSEDTH